MTRGGVIDCHFIELFSLKCTFQINNSSQKSDFKIPLWQSLYTYACFTVQSEIAGVYFGISPMPFWHRDYFLPKLSVV